MLSVFLIHTQLLTRIPRKKDLWLYSILGEKRVRPIRNSLSNIIIKIAIYRLFIFRVEVKLMTSSIHNYWIKLTIRTESCRTNSVYVCQGVNVWNGSRGFSLVKWGVKIQYNAWEQCWECWEWMGFWLKTCIVSVDIL